MPNNKPDRDRRDFPVTVRFNVAELALLRRASRGRALSILVRKGALSRAEELLEAAREVSDGSGEIQDEGSAPVQATSRSVERRRAAQAREVRR